MTSTVTHGGETSAAKRMLSAAGRVLRPALPALAMVVLTAAVAFAAGGEGHGEGPTTKDWMLRIINFSVIAIGIAVIYFKVIKGVLRKRIDGIESALAEAKAAREEALTRLADVEARLKDKDAELARLVSVAQENGVKEKALLVEEGAKMSEDIVASARDNIDAELIKAKDELRREAALLALELAEKMVKENINASDRSKIIEEYIAKVGG